MTILLALLPFMLFHLVEACYVYRMTSLPGCEQDFAPTIPALNSSTVTYGTECLLLCRNNNKCNGISICPDSGDPGRFSCSLFGTATDGTCGSLTSEAGCRYLEFEIVPNGPQCVPPRIFDEERDECACDPVWMYGPNCDQYYKDCTEAYTDGLRVASTKLVMEIKPVVSPDPFQVQCILNWGGHTVFQESYLPCSFDHSGLGWNDFRDGFGGFSCSYHLGLQKAYEILQNGVSMLVVYIQNAENRGNAFYVNFTLGNEGTNFRVDWYELAGFSDMEDGLGYGDPGYIVKGARFATHDNDFNGCAQAEGTGWWYDENCALVNLNMPLNAPTPAGAVGSAAWPMNGSLQNLYLIKLRLNRQG